MLVLQIYWEVLCMHNSKSAWFKLITFVIVFIMINYALTFAFVPKGNNTRMTMREMYSKKKI